MSVPKWFTFYSSVGILVSASYFAYGSDITIKTDNTSDPTSAPISLTSCQGALKAITTATYQFKDACGDNSKCLSDVAKCTSSADDATSGILNGEASPENCKNLVSVCPEFNAGTSKEFQQSKREAANERNNAQSDLSAATKDFTQQQNQNAQQQIAAGQAVIKDGQDHRNKVQELQNNSTEALKSAESKKQRK